MGNNRAGALDLEDRRTTARYAEFVKKAYLQPATSIYKLGETKHQSKAYYRLFENDDVDNEKIFQTHQCQVERRIADYDTVLCIQDSSELDYSTSAGGKKGLGRLNYDARQGLFIHPTLVVGDDGIALGVTDNWVWTRKTKGEALVKESLRWLEGYQRICELSTHNPQTRHIYVADRESDLLSIITWAAENNHLADYLLRAKHNRVLADGAKLFDQRHAELLGEISFVQPGGHGRKQRDVHQKIYAKRATLASGVKVSIILAVEEHPPKGSRAVSWKLLTNRRVEDLTQAVELIEHYRKRWMIETLFNVLKNGCKVENRHLGTLAGLERMILIYLLISWRIMLMMTLSREAPDISCELLFSKFEWRTAFRVRHRKKPPRKAPTLGEMVQTIAEIAGFKAQKKYPHPGVKSLWEGLQALSLCVMTNEAILHS